MTIPTHLDHIVVATPDLAGTVAAITAATGVTPEAGGVHPRFGTRNHLMTFGEGAYLEIIGLDPAVGTPEQVVFGLDRVTAPVARTFAVHPADPDAALTAAAAAGADLGPLGDGSRRAPDGTLLTWRLTRPLAADDSGVIPFVIDWGATPSPAGTIGARVDLVVFELTHPDPDALGPQLAALGTDVRVVRDDVPGLTLAIAGPGGTWTPAPL